MVKQVKAAQAESVQANDNENMPLVAEKSLYKKTSAIEAAISAAIEATNTVKTEWQRLLCSVALHVATHKDIRVIRNLLDNFPEGLRRNAASAFLDKFAPVHFDNEGMVHYSKDKKLHLADALKTAWWKVGAPEAAYRPYNLLAELKRDLAIAQRRIKTADASKGDFVTAEAIGELSITISKLELLQPKPQAEQSTAPDAQRQAA